MDETFPMDVVSTSTLSFDKLKAVQLQKPNAAQITCSGRKI